MREKDACIRLILLLPFLVTVHRPRRCSRGPGAEVPRRSKRRCRLCADLQPFLRLATLFPMKVITETRFLPLRCDLFIHNEGQYQDLRFLNG